MAGLLFGLPSAAAGADVDVGIQAFGDVCIATAPSFERAAKEAEKYGAVATNPDGFEVRKDGGVFAVVVKPNLECAVRTKPLQGGDAAAQFLKAAGVYAGLASPPERLPFEATYEGVTFTYSHASRDGEIYSMATGGGQP